MKKPFHASVSLSLVVAAALLVPATGTATEPDDSFATATGPLTAGQTLKGSLETINDADFNFFYIPNTANVTVTTINSAKKAGKGPSGKTIVSSLLRARRGKLPVPLADTQRTLGPGKKAAVKVTLVPGKYFVPIGHAATKTDPAAGVPYQIKIGPVGSTTTSYEIFDRRCKDAKSKVLRIESSKRKTGDRLRKARRHRASNQTIRKLQGKLRSKRGKLQEAHRVKRIVCSVPR